MDTESTSRQIREIENAWILLSDGCRLAARIWMPEDARENPVPAILEYLPYRKRDGTTERDALTHPYMAAQGYACIRVDMRGNGESDGLMADEYTPREQADALEVIQWIADQDWCSGNVGMIGISWGGFNGLQTAFCQPEHLKAVVTICSTDDRYADDVHYMGGCLLNYNLAWATTMLGYSTRPPDPVLVGEDWKALWLNRLENLPYLIEPWLTHQHRDAYWKHGSICEDYGRIKVPVFLVGGWADGYSNTIFRMLEHLKVPVKALIGPWAHKYPHFAKPGPATGFLQLCTKFWDRWLKGVDNDIMDEKVTLYLEKSRKPRASQREIPGQWVTRKTWPPQDSSLLTLYPCPAEPGRAAGILARSPGRGEAALSTPQTLGAAGGRWFSFGTGPDLPCDQTGDDLCALSFDTPELTDPVRIMGAPVLKLRLKSDRPLGLVAARLNDVRPDGSVARISYGLLNLSHRESHEFAKAMVPGKSYDIEIRLNEAAWVLEPGHRIRLSLSNTYWPMVWPSPETGVLDLDLSGAVLSLPTVPKAGRPPQQMEAPRSAPPLDQAMIRPARLGWTVEEDMETGEQVTRILDDYGDRIIRSHGLRTAYRAKESWHILPEDPLSAVGKMEVETRTGRDDWQVKTVVETEMDADGSHFFIHARVRALEGERRVFQKSWDLKIPRSFV